MEKKQRNLELSHDKAKGMTNEELRTKYKTSQANINRIPDDTIAKYPEEFTVEELKILRDK